jgi:vitamin B12 transporter
MMGDYLKKAILSASVSMALALIACSSTLWAQELSASAASSLDALVVTSSRTEEAKREVTSNITVLNQQDIARSTASNLAGILEQNGFQVYDNGSGARTLYIRGIGASSMTPTIEYPALFLINGHRTGTQNMTLLGLQNVERIEIIRGPSAMQYGNSSLAGVVNIITKRGEAGLTGSIEAGVGSFGRFDQKLGLSGAANGFDFSLGLANTKHDDYETGAGSVWRHTSLKSNLGVDLELGYTFLEKHRLGVHFNYFNTKDDEIPTSAWIDTNAYPSSFNLINHDSYNATIFYDGAAENDLFNWGASFTFGKIKSENATYHEPGSLLTWGSTIVWPNVAETYDTIEKQQEAQIHATFDNRLVSVTAGLEYITSKYNTISEIFPFHSVTNYLSKNEDLGIYLIGKLRLLDEKLIFTASGRYDSYENTSRGMRTKFSDTNFSPAFGAAWLPVDFLKLRANYSEGFNLPTARQSLGDGNFYGPAPNALKPQKTQNFEFGADLSWNFIEANLTYFHTNYKNQLTAVPSTSSPVYNFINRQGKSIYSGLEFGLKADLGQAFNQDFSLTPYINLTHMIDRKTGDENNPNTLAPQTINDVPKLMASYGLIFDHPGINLTANLNAVYIGKRWTNDFSNNSPTSGQYVNYGGLTVVNFSLDKRLWDFNEKGNLALRLEINNLFDKDYAYVMGYPMPGSNFYAGLRYNY